MEVVRQEFKEIHRQKNKFSINGSATPLSINDKGEAGFETYFVELAEAGDPGRRQELAAKYGVTYSSVWVAELTSRFGLKLLGQ